MHWLGMAKIIEGGVKGKGTGMPNTRAQSPSLLSRALPSLPVPQS